jgi:hypothetical protein
VLDVCGEIVSAQNNTSKSKVSHQKWDQAQVSISCDDLQINIIVTHLHQLFSSLKGKFEAAGHHVGSHVNRHVFQAKIIILVPGVVIGYAGQEVVRGHKTKGTDSSSKKAGNYT